MTKYDLIRTIENFNEAIIAIDGPSASGKTTLANEIKQQFGAIIIHMDDYFLASSQRTSEIAGNIDFDRLNEEVFNNLKSPHIKSNHFNCKTNTLEMRQAQKRKPLVVIEGAYSMHPKINNNYDFKVFMDISEANQQSRLIKRNGKEKYLEFRDIWIPRENHYFNKLDIKKTADMLIKEI